MAPFRRSSNDTADTANGTADTANETADEPQVNRKVETPEDMARDAVANGAGALTKRTVTRDDNQHDNNQRDNQPAKQNQTVTVIPPDAPLVDDGQSDYDRGKDVLRQFQKLDAQSATSPPAQSSTEQSTNHFTPKINHHNNHDGNGGVFWLFTIIFIAVTSFIIVKKFLLTDKPALTKSQLFEDSSSRLRAVTDKVKPVPKVKATPDVKPAEPPPKPQPPPKDDGKGKHFEVRV